MEERRDLGRGDGYSAEDMATSPTSYLAVARGIKPRYYYQLSSSTGLYPSLLLWHVPALLGKSLAAARVLGVSVARVPALLIRRHS